MLLTFLLLLSTIRYWRMWVLIASPPFYCVVLPRNVHIIRNPIKKYGIKSLGKLRYLMRNVRIEIWRPGLHLRQGLSQIKFTFLFAEICIQSAKSRCRLQLFRGNYRRRRRRNKYKLNVWRTLQFNLSHFGNGDAETED